MIYRAIREVANFALALEGKRKTRQYKNNPFCPNPHHQQETEGNHFLTMRHNPHFYHAFYKFSININPVSRLGKSIFG